MNKRKLAIGVAVATVGIGALALAPQIIRVSRRWRRSHA